MPRPLAQPRKPAEAAAADRPEAGPYAAARAPLEEAQLGGEPSSGQDAQAAATAAGKRELRRGARRVGQRAQQAAAAAAAPHGRCGAQLLPLPRRGGGRQLSRRTLQHRLRRTVRRLLLQACGARLDGAAWLR